MRLRIKLNAAGCADGIYQIQAKGALVAELRRTDAAGPLAGWTPFAYAPIDPYGNGVFHFAGGRAVPPGATCVLAVGFSSEMGRMGEAYADIPKAFLPSRPALPDVRFSVLSDLHLSAKTWTLRQALRFTASEIVLMTGDLTNDGMPEQFALLKQCLEEEIPEKCVLTIPGNHDMPLCGNVNGYIPFWRALAGRLATFPIDGSDGWDYALRIGDVDVIGLQCVSEGRKVVFPGGKDQLRWLENRLDGQKAAWHIILCHAPLLSHNPRRSCGEPYLNRDTALQTVIERHNNIVFLSGHTHASPNTARGSAEFDDQRQNCYIDMGSTAPTELVGTELLPAGWKDGVVTELEVAAGALTVNDGHGRIFCVSVIRQSQEWRYGNRAESGELPLGDHSPGRAPRYARRRREYRGVLPGTLSLGEFVSCQQAAR